MTGTAAPAGLLATVQSAWRDAVGAAIAAESEPVAERAGVVTVACRSAVWAQELELIEADLRARLEACTGLAELLPLRFVVARPTGT